MRAMQISFCAEKFVAAEGKFLAAAGGTLCMPEKPCACRRKPAVSEGIRLSREKVCLRRGNRGLGQRKVDLVRRKREDLGLPREVCCCRRKVPCCSRRKLVSAVETLCLLEKACRLRRNTSVSGESCLWRGNLGLGQRKVVLVRRKREDLGLSKEKFAAAEGKFLGAYGKACCSRRKLAPAGESLPPTKQYSCHGRKFGCAEVNLVSANGKLISFQ